MGAKDRQLCEDSKFLSKSLSKGVIVTVLVALFLNQQFDVAGYLLNSQEVTYLYEQHYVHPNQVEINFPKEKRNLVYIVLESRTLTLVK